MVKTLPSSAGDVGSIQISRVALHIRLGKAVVDNVMEMGSLTSVEMMGSRVMEDKCGTY